MSIDRVECHTYEELLKLDPHVEKRHWQDLTDEDKLFLTNAISQDRGTGDCCNCSC